MTRYIDAEHLFKCETCRHHSADGCNTWCENGECYSPDMSKIPTADVVKVVRSSYINDVGTDGHVTARPAEPPSEEHWGQFTFIINPDDKEELLRRCELVFDDAMKELKRAALEDPEKYFIIKRESDKDLLSVNTVGFKVSVCIKR